MAHAPGFLKIVEASKTRIQEIDVASVAKKLAAKASFFFVDVREDDEWKTDHATGAIHVGKGVIERDIEEKIPDKNSEIVLYCGGGFRSALAAEALQKMGYTQVTSMIGGIRAWREAGHPITSDPG